jgi:peptidyl-prolyl cis-trans isomerase D
MLKSMRESFHHLKWILLAVVAAFIIGFVYVDMGLGGAGQQRTQNRTYAARVNGDTVSFNDFNRALSYTEDNYRRMYGQQFTPEMEQQMGLQRQVLDSLIDQRLLIQEAARIHLTATPEEVRRKILQIPTLNQNGTFVGTDLYERYVRMSGFSSSADFEDELAKEITVGKMESALQNSVVVSPKAAEAEYRRTAESAKIKYALYSASREVAAVSVAPQDVESYYKAHQDQYAHGEQRHVKYLVADLARIRSQVVPTEAQLRQRYEAAKDAEYKHPQQAHIDHILIKVSSPAEDAAAKAKAENIVKQLRAGADFGALAKANSQDPSSAGNGGDMGWVDKDTTVAPFDQAAFSIPLNTISDPIRSQEFGYHIIKVLERRPAGYRTFDEVRGPLANTMASDLAKDMARDEISKVAARVKAKKPATAAEFSSYANDRVASNDSGWFGKGDSIPGMGFNQQFEIWAFTAKQGDVSDPIGTQRGPVIAYVDGIRPAGVTSLDDIREKVTTDAKMEKARQLAQQKLAAAVAGSPSIDVAAQKAGLTTAETTISRQGFVSGIPGDTTALVDAVMSAQPGQLKGPVVAGDGAVIFQVTEQKKITPDELAKNGAQYIDGLRQREARSLRTSLLQRLRKASKVEVNEQVLTGTTPRQDQQS